MDMPATTANSMMAGPKRLNTRHQSCWYPTRALLLFAIAAISASGNSFSLLMLISVPRFAVLARDHHKDQLVAVGFSALAHTHYPPRFNASDSVRCL